MFYKEETKNILGQDLLYCSDDNLKFTFNLIDDFSLEIYFLHKESSVD